MAAMESWLTSMSQELMAQLVHNTPLAVYFSYKAYEQGRVLSLQIAYVQLKLILKSTAPI